MFISFDRDATVGRQPEFSRQIHKAKGMDRVVRHLCINPTSALTAMILRGTAVGEREESSVKSDLNQFVDENRLMR